MKKVKSQPRRITARDSGLGLLCLLTGLTFLSSALYAETAKSANEKGSSITVQTDRQGRKASPMLYGIFVEDWSHQVEGGIYAEMLRNRSFDDTKSAKEVLVMGFAMNLPDSEKEKSGPDLSKNAEIPGWKVMAANRGGMDWAIDQSHPINPKNPRSLRLNVNTVSDKIGIYNEGWCTNVTGIAVTQGSGYRFSCYARSESSDAGLAVSIQTFAGKILASEKISGLSEEWKKYELTLLPSESCTGARLVVSPTSTGTYYLDMISLFPKETWKNRPNGLRPDIMNMVAAMKPAFVRFPGGCFVEGLELDNAWHWKRTIGPVEERPGHWNIWGWRSSDGMGYFEYLQMCEDLGAEPVHVVNDGISHTAKDGVQEDGVYTYQPMDKMDVLVQDALDSIEYANGPVDSKWGAMRAAAGHPKPFNLKYIEVGNENFGPEYAARYALFQDAIKEKYPEITVIMDTWGPDNYPKNRIPDILDIHRFAPPFEFALNYNQFDKYDRKGPKVYFGEWCVELELPHKESLETGLYEGAFLTGLEKNSDLVVMMSYAPFMKNPGWQDRKPNMINFDLDRVYGAPIYWIQKMYSEHRVETLLDFNTISPEYRPAKSGSIGIGTQDTQAEFKDIQVTSADGSVLFDGNTASAGVWMYGKGGNKVWKTDRGAFSQSGNGLQTALVKQEFSGDYTLTLKARKLDGKNGFLVYFQTKDFWQLGGDGNRSAKIVGREFKRPEIPKFTIENNRWYDLKVEVRGDQVACYVDGKPVNQTSYLPLQSLYVSAGRNESASEIVLKVINISPEVQSTRIQLPGAKLEPVGKATVITAKDPLDQNSRETPNKVIPHTAVVQNVSDSFEYEFPAYSATVLQLRQKTDVIK